MKRHKICLVLLLSLALGCGNGQNTDGEKQAENLTQTETQKQEGSVTEAPKRSEIVIQNTSTGQKPTPTPNPEETDEQVVVYNVFASGIEIADDGILYAIGIKGQYNEYPSSRIVRVNKPWQYILAFDENGTCLWDMYMVFPTGYSWTEHEKGTILAWSDGFLYAVLPKHGKTPVLYRLNQETWEWQELYCFEKFSKINNVVFMEGKCYVCGILAKPGEKPLVQNLKYLEEHPNTYKGEAIGYIDMKNMEAGVTLLPIDVPMELVKLTEDTLGIYQLGDDAYYFMRYIPTEEKWEKTEIAVYDFKFETPSRENFVGYEDGCFYIKRNVIPPYDSICYATADGVEIELKVFSDEQVVDYLKSDGTFLYYRVQGGPIDEVQAIRISDLFERFTAENE